MKSRTSKVVGFLTRPILPRRAISIEPHQVAVASVAWKKGRLAVTGAAAEPIPPGLIEPRFSDINIKDKDRMSRLIQQTLEKAGLLSERRWSLAVPRKATRGFIIQLEETPKTKRELTEVLQWRVERLLEIAMTDLTAAFQRLSPANGQERFLVVAASNEVLASYEAVLEPLKIQPGYVVPAHLAETAWLQLEPYEHDALLIAAEPDEATIIFLRGGDFLSIRSVEYDAHSLADEVHRTLVYYMDRLAPHSESGPDARLETILLVGEPLNVKAVEASCRTLFPLDRLPAIQTLSEVKLEGYGGLTLESISSAAGLAAMGL